MKFRQVLFSRTLHSRYLALHAPVLGAGWYTGLYCSGESWFRIPVPDGGSLEVTIWFAHARGDLDLFLYSGTGAEIDRSESTTDSERVRTGWWGGTYSVNVRGYNGAQNAYSMKVDIRLNA